MKCDDVIELLRRYGIKPEDVVAINGDPRQHDMYHIMRRDGMWEVYYAERGHKWDCRQFESEEEACDYLWELLRRDETIWR